MHSAVDAQAQVMATEGHGTFLSVVLTSLRREAEDSVVETLRLLRAMWGTSLASRPLQQAALNDVGVWLEKRVNREPGVSAAQLLEEVTWIRRLSKYYLFSQPGMARPAAPTRPQFGERIDAMARRRKERPAAVSATLLGNSAPISAAPETPTVLPDEFDVELVDLRQAREVLRRWKDRKKQGKATRDHNLQVVPVLVPLRSLAAGLFLSLETTEGLLDAFDRHAARGGAGLLLLRVVARRGLAITRVAFAQ